MLEALDGAIKEEKKYKIQQLKKKKENVIFRLYNNGKTIQNNLLIHYQGSKRFQQGCQDTKYIQKNQQHFYTPQKIRKGNLKSDAIDNSINNIEYLEISCF